MDLAIMNVAMNICVIFISYGKWSIIARSFDKYLIFQEIARWSLKVTAHFTSPPAVYEGSSFFTSSLTFGIFSPLILALLLGFPGSSDGKASACNARDLGSIPGSGRFPGEGKGNPLQYYGLKNSVDCIVHVVTKSQIWLSDFHFHSTRHIIVSYCDFNLMTNDVEQLFKYFLPFVYILWYSIY